MIQIITKDDLDGKTIQVNNEGKVFAVLPSGETAEDEFEVVENYVKPEPDDEFYVKDTPVYLKHKETGLVIQGSSAKKFKRGEPRNEVLTEVQIRQSAYGNTIEYDCHYTSGIDQAGQDPVYRYNINLLPYANALEFNKAKLTVPITTQERFSEVEPHEKILSVTQEYPLPEEPYQEVAVPLSGEISNRSIQLSAHIPFNYKKEGLFSGEVVVEVVRDTIEPTEEQTVFHTLTYGSNSFYIHAGNLIIKPNIFRESEETRDVPKKLRIKSSTLKLATFNGVVNFTA
ncbi:hypothetical protein [Haemophilus parahaemolyticus]|uniref:hypothetical protein n=1 Tax=Haemophilus parahaemolyticus TaxID=735 RepID=UPI0028F0D399|nr:hypothetical protein [Haemophilus parahaemolyticus]